MSAANFDSSIDQAKKSANAADSAVDHGQRAFAEAISAAERTFADAAKTAEKVFRDGVESLRSHGKVYGEEAGQRMDEAQRYVLERVKERPVTATLAGLGVGLLLGLLLSNRNK
jgi:ElaB/YqjD/DUF883 family membrane-anchored ribosome-binding protein